MVTVKNIPSYSLYINGEWQKGTGGEHVRYSPAHGEPVAKYEKASQEDAERSIRMPSGDCS